MKSKACSDLALCAAWLLSGRDGRPACWAIWGIRIVVCACDVSPQGKDRELTSRNAHVRIGSIRGCTLLSHAHIMAIELAPENVQSPLMCEGRLAMMKA